MNPFRETIVASPWEATRVDVPGIHGKVFEQCLDAVEYVRRERRSAGLLIHGEAGSGKTHLLSRLRAKLTPKAPSATGREEYLYVWVRLQTSPRMIWRTLRRTLVEDWFRPVAGSRSQFERILFHRLAQIRTAEGDLERWYEYMLDEVPDGLAELMNRIAETLHLDRNTAIAFEHIAFRRHLRDLRAWLGGTSLPEAALNRLDLAQDEGTDEEREDESRRVVLMLCKLAGESLPIVLSFDQVEALEMTPGDRDAVFAFGQLISTLHDETSNVLLLSCMQSSFLTQLRDHARGADYDRMKSLGTYSLDPLSRAEAEQLIAARLEAAGIADRPHACWPLEPNEFDALFAHGSISPRRLLTVCAERYEQRTAAPEVVPPAASEAPALSPAEAIGTFLGQKWDTVLEEKLAANAADRTEEIIRHGLPQLVQLLVPDVKLTHDDQLPDVALVFAARGGNTGISLCTQSNMTSLATHLKRLKVQLAQQRLRRLVIVRDSRIPISQTAKAARQRLDELERQQARIVFPSRETLAALDALRALLSDAKSGDLALHGEALAPRTVEEWLLANLPETLRVFVDEILGEPASGDLPASDVHDFEALNELLAQRPVLPVTEAAEALQQSSDDVMALARRHADHFGLLGQPPTVLFRAVARAEPDSQQ